MNNKFKDSFIYMINVDKLVTKPNNSFTVIQASWNTNFITNIVNLVFPVCIYVEKVSHYINIEDVYVLLKNLSPKINFFIQILIL